MSLVLDLPQEVLEFLRAEVPQTMLVRGAPGTGKTMFALSLLANYPGRRLFVSTRVPPGELRREFPWLGRSDLRIEAIDAADGFAGVHRQAEMLARARELILQPEGSSDLRPLWLPEPIQEAWSRSDPGSRTMVVLDSWDALIERYLGSGFLASPGAAVPDRPELERILLTQMARAPVFLALVAERDEPSQLDYLVNGVVHTRWERMNGRPERWIWLRKLRGTRIDTPEYPFTLDGGRFACISPLPIDFRAPLVPPVPEPDARPGQIWPGTPEFANAFGRLPLHRVSLIEREAIVPSEAIRLVIGPMMAHILQSGGRLVHVLPPDSNADDVWRGYRELIGIEQFRRQVRIQAITSDSSEEVQSVVLPPPRPSGGPTEPHLKEAIQFLREAPADAPNLMVVWVDGLVALAELQEFEYTPQGLPAVAVRVATGAPIHLLFIGVDGDRLTREVRALSSIHLRFLGRNGRVFIEGDKPLTPPFVLALGEHPGPYHLVRVV